MVAIRRVHRSLLCLLLASLGAWLAYAGSLTRQPPVIAECLLAFGALGLGATGSRFTCYPVILLALLMSAEWLTWVFLSVRIGYFAHLRPQALLQALLPGILMELAALYAVIVALAFYPRGSRTAP